MKIKTALLTALLTILASGPAMAEKNHENALALVEAWLEVQRAYDRIPGVSAAIVHDQDLIWSGAFGHADLEEQAPATTETIYGICSISKLFTGIAAMQLRDQGVLRLDDPIDELLPWFNLEQGYEGSPAITLETLLTHSGGLPREADAPYWMGPDYTFPTRKEMRERLSGQSTLYPASEYYQYSNLGLSLVGEIVTEQSGQPYDEYVREHILKPMGLEDTDTRFPTGRKASRVATGYGPPTREGDISPLPRYDARAITPAAGFSSTALDLARFASWQLRVREGDADDVLASNTLKEMQRVHFMDWDWSTSWGLAFGIYRIDGRTITGHSGHCPGFATRVYIDPISKYGVAVMANRNAADVSGYARTILDILEANGAPPRKASADEPAVNYSDYVGAYDLYPWGGESLVVEWEGGLSSTWVPSSDPAGGLTKLKHIEGDVFRIVRSDKKLGDEVEFVRDKDGQVTGLKRHGLTVPRRL